MGSPEAWVAPPARPATAAVLDVLAQAASRAGVEAYLVGGFVRDRLLGLGDGKDIDIVCVGDDGVGMLQEVARAFGWSRPQRFEHFGTAQVRGDGFIVESVRARAERYDPDSRRPSVRPGTLEEDVWRRDFTVNTLCQAFDGRLIDVTGRGLADLRDGVLRTPLDPGETFAEDPLRMFRAARFAARLSLTPAPGLLEAMRTDAQRWSILSVERIAEELRGLLVAERPSRGLELLREGGVLAAALPELAAMVGVEQSGHHLWDVWGHTVRAVDLSAARLRVRLATLLHDVGKPPCHSVAPDGRHTFHDHPGVGADMAARILERLRFPNDTVREVATLVRLHLRPIQYQPETHSDAAVRRLVRDAGELRTDLLEVARADTRASGYPDTDAIEELEARMARLDAGGAVSRLRSPLDGNALQRIYGRGPGRWIGGLQAALEEAVLRGEVPPGDPGAAEAWLRSHPEVVGD